jgi:hypothetical protein
MNFWENLKIICVMAMVKYYSQTPPFLLETGMKTKLPRAHSQIRGPCRKKELKLQR